MIGFDTTNKKFTFGRKGREGIVVFDLDGTLVENKTGYAYDISDPIIAKNVRKIREEYKNHKVYIVTGRKYKEYFQKTHDWLHKHDGVIPYDSLFMQAGSMGKKNHLYKKDVIDKIKQDGGKILRWYDNNPLVRYACEINDIEFIQV